MSSQPESHATSLGRRALPRVAASFPVRLRLDGLGWLDAHARDLGVGGVCAATPSCFAPERLRSVTLVLPHERIELEAEARWQLEVAGQHGFFTGVQFLDVGEETEEELWDLVHAESKNLSRWLGRQRDLAELCGRDALDLAQVTRLRDVPPGVPVYRQGVRDDSIFVVRDGEVVLERRTARQRRLTMGHAEPGQILGGLGVVADCVPNETAVANRATSLLEISRGAFQNLLANSPGLAFRITSLVMQSHLRRVDQALGRLADEAP